MVHIIGRIGSMSYNIVKNRKNKFREGLDYIQAQFPFYNKETLTDEYNNCKYSLQMILESIDSLINEEEILKLILFDCLIGNSDRHHSNWAVMFEIKDIDKVIIAGLHLAPLYDNGSSLCSYVNEEDINQILNDNMRFEALINTKSKSAIGWENERPIKHFELIEKIKENYYEKTVQYVKIIQERINEENIKNMLNLFSEEIISDNMKRLLLKFLLERRNRILDIYEMKDGE